VIVVDGQSAHGLQALGRRLIQATDQPFILPGGVTARVGMAVGIANLSPGGDPATAMDQADRNMYLMKSRHKTSASERRRTAVA
jgi:GGDEF domain-containing protein